MLPTTVWPLFGKVLFCTADIASGVLIHSIRSLHVRTLAPNIGKAPIDLHKPVLSSQNSITSHQNSRNKIKSPKRMVIPSDSTSSEQVKPVEKLIGSEKSALDYSETEIPLSGALLWLLNPFVAIISARGNAESIISFLVLLTLYFLRTKRNALAAIVYGLAVHLKIYPIIYCVPIWFGIDFCSADSIFIINDDFKNAKQNQKSRIQIGISDNITVRGMDIERNAVITDTLHKQSSAEPETRAIITLNHKYQLKLFSFARIKFGLLAMISFMSLNGLMWGLYGDIYISESWIYHLTRQDHRHNFSVYFYNIYLTLSSPARISLSSMDSFLQKTWTFVPQIVAMIILGTRYAHDLEFAFLILTFVFIMLNKVVTSQYFVWFLTLLPLILNSKRTLLCSSFNVLGIFLLGVWIAAQVINFFNSGIVVMVCIPARA